MLGDCCRWKGFSRKCSCGEAAVVQTHQGHPADCTAIEDTFCWHILPWTSHGIGRSLQYCKVIDEKNEGQGRDLSMNCVGMDKKALGETLWEKSILNWEKNDASPISSEVKSGTHRCQALHSGLGLVSSSRVSSAMLWGRQGGTVSGIIDKATSGKNFYHQKKKGEQKTGEIELVCVCVCLKGRMFCSTLLRKSLEENSVGLGQEKLTQKNVRNQNRR